jgi:hypothetical protein
MWDKEYDDWLAGLKVGDKVIVNGGHMPTSNYVDRVAKRTATGIITLRGDIARCREGSKPRTFDKNGYERGARSGLWSHRVKLERPSEEAIRAIQKAKWASRLSNISYDKLSGKSYEALETAYKALFGDEQAKKGVGQDGQAQADEGQG